MNLDELLGVVHYFPTEGNPVYLRKMCAPAGRVIGSHKHVYEHYSILCSGIATVHMDGDTSKRYDGPSVMIVPAGVEHRIEANTEIVWFCVHGTTETENIDEVLIEGS